MPNAALRIDEIQGRPMLIVERSPDRMLAVDGDRIIHTEPFHFAANIAQVLLKRELRRMHTDYDQTLVPVFFGPGADIRQRAQPVDARVGPEVDEDDLTTQRRCVQRRRIDPLIRALKRPQRSLTGSRRRLISMEEGQLNALRRDWLRHTSLPEKARNWRAD